MKIAASSNVGVAVALAGWPDDEIPDVAVRCLIVDDSPSFLDAARAMLRSDGVEVVGTATTAAEALRIHQELHPDVTLVDVDLGAESGFDVVLELHRGCIPAPVVVLTSTRSESDLIDLLAVSPARGFLPKFQLSGSALRGLVEHG